MESPVVVIIFNRPDQASQLRERLRAEESRELFVVSDGPREDRSGERLLVEECRRIFSDWPGTLNCNFAETNMGCKSRVSSGLDWVFEHADRAIILEDDCLPHPGFFRFCDELLETYFGNETVMSVCGTKTFPQRSGNSDFIFTKYASSWGWATWKRAWSKYDDQFKAYSTVQIINVLRTKLGSIRAAFYWFYLLRKVQNNTISSWAYCWNISCFIHHGLHAYSNENLVINAGFGPAATHTTDIMPYMPQHYGKSPTFPLKYSSNISSCIAADKWIDGHIYSKSIIIRLLWIWQKLKRY